MASTSYTSAPAFFRGEARAEPRGTATRVRKCSRSV